MSQTILIVDDLEINRVVARTIFEEKYNILEAASGEECIELAKKHPHDIDLILLNLVMPGISGMDILQLRKEGKIFPNTPVIVLTASEDVPTQIHAFNLGAIDYITIPFIREITVYRVANALYFSEQLMELERQKDRFRLKSEKDLMTGLFNKVTTEERIENALAVRTGGALFLFDIDNFKDINDTFGHSYGDKVICEVAHFIKRQFRSRDCIGRIGGDEFVAYMDDIHDRDTIRHKADAIAANLKDSTSNQISSNINISWGIAWKPEHIGADYAHLFKTADTALYEKKRNGKNGYIILDVPAPDDISPAACPPVSL